VHGLAPFQAAAKSGGATFATYSWWALKTFTFTEEPLLPLMAVVGFFGLFVCLAQQKLFLPAWLLAIFILQPRLAATPATVPLAMMIGMAIDRIILPGIAHTAVENEHRWSSGNQSASGTAQ
jgi:hypothetical protein